MSDEPFMSEETLVCVCPNDDVELVDTFAIGLGVLGVLGSIITYFIQRNQERVDALEAKEKEDIDIDRAQALERVRRQLSVLVGPLHRAWKIHMTVLAHYMIESGHGIGQYTEILSKRGQLFWTRHFNVEFLQPFIENPYSEEAVMYRNFVTRRLRPCYTKIRELVMNHMADLADMPTQEEWLERWTEEEATSPYNGSLNINVIFDSYTAWSLEFDDIVESWAQEDFRRMQPTMRVPFMICNDLIDLLYDKAKEKEAKYNKHVTIHKNERQEIDDRGDKKGVDLEAKWFKSFMENQENGRTVGNKDAT